MLISPEEYLSLTDQIALLSLKSKSFQAENKKLNQQVLKQRETLKFLNQRLSQQIKKHKQTEQELKKHIDNNSQSVKIHISQQYRQQLKYFDQQISKIKNDANVQKIKEIQKKMTENRFINHQMVDFYQKIDSLYKVLNKVNKSPSMPELYKWVSIRKAQELIAMFLPNNGTKKTIQNIGSKMNLSMSRTIGSKTSIAGQRNTMNSSKVQGMGMSKFGMNSSKIGAANKPPLNNKGKQNKSSPKVQNDRNSHKPPLNKKQQKKVEITSTQSLTQQMNLGNTSQIVNASQTLVPEIQDENKSKIQQSIVKVSV